MPARLTNPHRSRLLHHRPVLDRHSNRLGAGLAGSTFAVVEVRNIVAAATILVDIRLVEDHSSLRSGMDLVDCIDPDLVDSMVPHLDELDSGIGEEPHRAA